MLKLPLDEDKWQAALESRRTQKQDFLQRLTTLNAGGLALSISVLTGLSQKGGSGLNGKYSLIACWIALLFSMILALTYMARHPELNYSGSLIALLAEAKRMKRLEPGAFWKRVREEPGSESLLHFANLDASEAAFRRLVSQLDVLYASSLVTGLLGYAFLIMFAVRNLLTVQPH